MKKHRKGREILSFIPSATRDLLFPPRCVGCDDLLPPFAHSATVFCPLCRTAWETAVIEAANDVAGDAERELIYLVHYRSGQEGGVPERLIYHLKHRGDPRTFAFLARRLASRLPQTASAHPSERADELLLFTYPPRRRSAVNRDGFDQARRLAKAMAKSCGGEMVSLVRRTHRKTTAQKMLNAEDRTANAISAYVLTPNASAILRDRTVVVCDDLCTTGATLNRCADLLLAAGAKRVILCSVARTAKWKMQHT